MYRSIPKTCLQEKLGDTQPFPTFFDLVSIRDLFKTCDTVDFMYGLSEYLEPSDLGKDADFLNFTERFIYRYILPLLTLATASLSTTCLKILYGAVKAEDVTKYEHKCIFVGKNDDVVELKNEVKALLAGVSEDDINVQSFVESGYAEYSDIVQFLIYMSKYIRLSSIDYVTKGKQISDQQLALYATGIRDILSSRIIVGEEREKHAIETDISTRPYSFRVQIVNILILYAKVISVMMGMQKLPDTVIHETLMEIAYRWKDLYTHSSRTVLLNQDAVEFKRVVLGFFNETNLNKVK